MFTTLRRLIGQLFSKSRTINNTPLNKISLIVIILIDTFILVNVFMGINDIGQWYISPEQAYPCYSQWNSYLNSNSKDKDYEILTKSFDISSPDYYISSNGNTSNHYQNINEEKLGSVSNACMSFAGYQDALSTPKNQENLRTINQNEELIFNLQSTNKTIREQYDSTLLEKIAGQDPSQSINTTDASKAKQELDNNNQRIANLKQEIAQIKTEIITSSESRGFLDFLQDEATFETLKSSYDRASFWYPSIQITFQFFFLCPLIIIAFSIHSLAQKKDYGLVALISWHLLVIFFIPLVVKLFEFLQFGVLAQFIFEIIRELLGGLLFLVSYVYILAIPLIGFGIIKLCQLFIFNTKLQAANRVQKSRCISCGKKLRSDHSHCPYCGYYQYQECSHCHNLTYKHLPHCYHCGEPQVNE